METWEINGDTLEYDDEYHQYLVNGICVPSVTQLLQHKFGKKYDGVSSKVLNKAAKKGTEIHKAIEDLCKLGEIKDYKEVRNFLFLQKHYGFEVLENEVPVILYKNDLPIAAGRLDMVMRYKGRLTLADIKRTSVLDKEYLGYQLNLYRIAYQQCYKKEILWLRGIHLREDKRKFAPIPVNEEMAWELVDEYLKESDKNEEHT